MQNSPEFDFSKILDQTLYTYILPEQLPIQKEVQKADTCITQQWPRSIKYSLVTRLWPIVMLIGVAKVIVGVVLLIMVVWLASDYDKLYATEDSKIISLMSFGGLITLVVSGMMLLTSLMLEKKRVMWIVSTMGFYNPNVNFEAIYIITSTFLCVYIFVLSVMKIHFALLVLERDTYKIILPESRRFLLSTACTVGIVTLLGSVIHCIGNVTVFTFYNLKYIQPILFNNGP